MHLKKELRGGTHLKKGVPPSPHLLKNIAILHLFIGDRLKELV